MRRSITDRRLAGRAAPSTKRIENDTSIMNLNKKAANQLKEPPSQLAGNTKRVARRKTKGLPGEKALRKRKDRKQSRRQSSESSTDTISMSLNNIRKVWLNTKSRPRKESGPIY